MSSVYKIVSVLLLAVIAFVGGVHYGSQPTIESDAEAYYRVFGLFKEACTAEHGDLVINLQDGHPGCNAK